MLRTLFALLIGLTALLGAAPALAQSSVQNSHTRLELLSESAAPAPGSTVTLGLRMTPEAGWHTYWKNPGESGIETQVAWELPAGASAGPLAYPAPETFVVAGIMNYVYSEPTTLLAELKVPEGLAPGTPLPVRARVDYLVCDDEICVPESGELALDLRVGGGAPGPDAGAIAGARQALPPQVDWPATFARAGERIVLEVPFAQAAQARSAYFFPLVDGAITYSAPQQVGRAGEALRIETAAGHDASVKSVPGVLKVDVGGQTRAFALVARPGEVAASAVPLGGAGGAGDGSGDGSGGGGLPGVGLALLLAVGGGLLLNIMPCVFPILSLKALSLARSGTSEAHARAEAVAYTAGVVTTTLALGAIILIARAAGAAAGWAFQLQDPRVILLLLLLMTAIALNLAGLFEIRLAGAGAGQGLAAKGGRTGAFWTGVLASLVATPCTGPFMGVALGAAIALPPAAGLAIFAGLGLGLALPFLALGFVPALRRRLPKPGPWMERFRRWLSIPMFVTALALAWVLGRQAGVAGMTLGLAAALLLGLALWWLGSRQREGGRGFAPLGLAAAAAIAGALLVAPQPPAAAGQPVETATLGAEPFSAERLDRIRAERRPAFVYFTADWCITCKVNERGAMASAEVARAFEAGGVEVLVGDWTNGDPAITRFLESHGRSGVPLYLYYHPGGRVELLPQILTVGRLTALPRATA